MGYFVTRQYNSILVEYFLLGGDSELQAFFVGRKHIKAIVGEGERPRIFWYGGRAEKVLERLLDFASSLGLEPNPIT